ncbi:hypothetical protein [Sulfitobacter guttiformis]|uniref:Uncharacterized protein n=1 Tax=Sulfitobacter guttiformis TaxID=74349 RepID=A0A420DNG9_9RHOB|nr:hypothetical protein [Sulfitobacter guttiformis]RKE95727.1 hypothetical protein C8N30_0264 [Sulfitobacter guttiformis]
MFEFILLLGVLGLAAYAYRRFGRSSLGGGGGMTAPAPVRAAARRLGYRVQPNGHITQSIHTPELCIAALATAFSQMDKREHLPEGVIAASLEKRLNVEAREAGDLAMLGTWLVTQSGGASPAFQLLAKRLKQLDHGPDFDKLMRVLGHITAAGSKGMASAPQADALGALASIFRTA